MEQQRLKISSRLKDLMHYEKLSGPVPRFMILRSEYWLDVACINAARMLGWELAEVPVVMEGVMSRDMVAQLIETLTAFKPDFVLSINLSGMDVGGIFAGLFEDLKIPYVTWFVDDPRTILMGRDIYTSEYSIALTWERAYTPYLEQAGFAEVHTLPLAVDETQFNGQAAEHTTLLPTFIGNSMIEFSQREWAWLEAYPELARALKTAFAENKVTRENFAAGLDAILGQKLVASLDDDQKRHAEMICFIEGTRRLRESLVRELSQEKIVVRGDEYWSSITPHCGPGVNYTVDLPHYYRDCVVNLNSTSIQMATTVNQRVFDCPAAGGFLLTDAQTELASLFDANTEIVTYTNWDECRDKVRYFKSNPDARLPYIERGRRRVLCEHTYKHRLQTIASIIHARFGG